MVAGSKNRRILPLLLAFLALGFVGLGVWQLERRTEKLALIAAVDHRAHAPSGEAPGPLQWPRIAAATDAYRAVMVRGAFLHGRDTLVQAVTDSGPGFWVVTPLRTDAGWVVLVNRGFIPADARDKVPAPLPGELTVTGLLRMSEPGGGFLHANDPAHDKWYSRDVGAIGRARHLDHPAPYFIDAGPTGRPDQPVGGLTVLSFPNNHLQYALTWFALAALCLVGAARAGRGKSR